MIPCLVAVMSAVMCFFALVAQQKSAEEVRLVDIKQLIPAVILDIRYATENNFTGKKIYTESKCYLAEDAAHALKNVQEELATKGLGLKVWDAYRPRSAQYKLWEIVPDEKYVANPEKGSKHNRACAIDLTLCSLADGHELEMPTGFDDFSQKAWRDYNKDDISPKAKENRAMLEAVMKKHGFIGLPTEWWHFDYKEWANYPLLDVKFSDLK